MKRTMLQFLGLGLGGVTAVIIKTAFGIGASTGIIAIVCCLCLSISAAYFAINSMED